MTVSKMRQKSVKKSVRPWQFRKGLDSRRGRGPAKGEGGRPKGEQRAFLRNWFDSVEGRAHTLERIARSDRIFVAMHMQAFGQAQQTIEHTGVVVTHVIDISPDGHRVERQVEPAAMGVSTIH